jgi:alcohol dehydrogenase (NADP+)
MRKWGAAKGKKVGVAGLGGLGHMGVEFGGIAETRGMLDFCGKHDVACDIEMIRMQQINEAYERMLCSDVKYRFVIDMASLKS